MVVSKTFTTAETMLNARTLKEWIQSALGLAQLNDEIIYGDYAFAFSFIYMYTYFVPTGFRPQAVAKHMVAVSTNIPVLILNLSVQLQTCFRFTMEISQLVKQLFMSCHDIIFLYV